MDFKIGVTSDTRSTNYFLPNRRIPSQVFLKSRYPHCAPAAVRPLESENPGGAAFTFEKRGADEGVP